MFPVLQEIQESLLTADAEVAAFRFVELNVLPVYSLHLAQTLFFFQNTPFFVQTRIRVRGAATGNLSFGYWRIYHIIAKILKFFKMHIVQNFAY